MEVVSGDVRNYLHTILDDDFTVNMNSNDKQAERLSEERSIRSYWKIRLPLKISIQREEFEVGIIAVQIKNVQRNSPRAFISDGGGNDVVSQRMVERRIETYGDLFQDLLPFEQVQDADLTCWLVMYEESQGYYIFKDIKQLIQTQFDNNANNNISLRDMMSNITLELVALGQQLSEPTYDTVHDFYGTLDHLCTTDFSTLSPHPSRRASQFSWAMRRYFFGGDNRDLFKSGLVMGSDTAYYLRLTDLHTIARHYEDGYVNLIVGNNYNADLKKNFFFVGDDEIYYNLKLLPKTGKKAGRRNQWQSNLPLRLSFEEGGNSDPNSVKKISLSVVSGKTLKFESVDGLAIYTFKKGVIFSGTPLAFYEFLNQNILNFKFLTPDVRSVNIHVKGLKYRTSPYTRQEGLSNDLLLVNLSLDSSLIHYVPPPKSRLYRILQYIDTEDLSVEIVDSLNPNRAPLFHVGISDITLHFREIWNNVFRD